VSTGLFVCLCVSICQSVCLSVCLFSFLYVCLCVCVSVCLSVCVSISQSVCLSVCLFSFLYVCLCVCLSISWSVNLFVCLFTLLYRNCFLFFLWRRRCEWATIRSSSKFSFCFFSHISCRFLWRNFFILLNRTRHYLHSICELWPLKRSGRFTDFIERL